MLLTIDSVATRYHLLPTQVLKQATTFDLHVLDLSTRWVNHQTKGHTTPQPTAAELKTMFDAVKAMS